MTDDKTILAALERCRTHIELKVSATRALATDLIELRHRHKADGRPYRSLSDSVLIALYK